MEVEGAMNYFHCTKNWIYTKITQCKFGAKIAN